MHDDIENMGMEYLSKLSSDSKYYCNWDVKILIEGDFPAAMWMAEVYLDGKHIRTKFVPLSYFMSSTVSEKIMLLEFLSDIFEEVKSITRW